MAVHSEAIGVVCPWYVLFTFINKGAQKTAMFRNWGILPSENISYYPNAPPVSTCISYRFSIQASEGAAFELLFSGQNRLEAPPRKSSHFTWKWNWVSPTLFFHGSTFFTLYFMDPSSYNGRMKSHWIFQLLYRGSSHYADLATSKNPSYAKFPLVGL